MIKSKNALMIIWTLAFILCVSLLFIIPDQITNITIATLIFSCIAFFSQLLLCQMITKTQNAEQLFSNMPIIVVSCMYLAIVFAFSVLFAMIQHSFSLKTIIIINIIILVTAWSVIVALLGTKGHIQRIDSRQKDHHIEL